MKHDPWRKLVKAARDADRPAPIEIPPGFATRVVAQAWSERSDESAWSLRFAWKAVAVAAFATAVVMALNVGSVTRLLDDDLAALSEVMMEDENLDLS